MSKENIFENIEDAIKEISVNKVLVNEMKEILDLEVAEDLTKEIFTEMTTSSLEEIRAYSNGTVVGATRISELNHPIALTAWGDLNNIGVESEGFIKGDNIELRLWSSARNKELNIIENFDNSIFSRSNVLHRYHFQSFFSCTQ